MFSIACNQVIEILIHLNAVRLTKFLKLCKSEIILIPDSYFLVLSPLLSLLHRRNQLRHLRRLIKSLHQFTVTAINSNVRGSGH